jgi:intracellular sulfur oxidation DsrE/DsrF family protein
MSKQSSSPSERRSFLTRLNAGVTSLAAMAVGGVAMAQVKPTATARWEPARHDKDDWLDKLPGKHRLLFDTTTPEGLGNALLFANNFMRVNRTDYGLENSDLAVVIVARHGATPLGYNDAMWAKYGTTLAARSKVEDPTTKLAPKRNIYNAADYGDLAANRGTTLDSLFKQGVQLAVCATATRGVSRLIAEAVGGNIDAIYNELTANLVSNARMVPAGIVAVNRAQERGYSLAST